MSVLLLVLAAGALGLLLGFVSTLLPRRDQRLIEAVNACLPQTQCGQCGYPGCRPYAQAIVQQGTPINRCPPGGEACVQKLSDLLNCENLALDPAYGTPPSAPQVARIDEASCIGCVLCVRACPVDAIIGAARYTHTIVPDQCTGCGLCLPPCPVDCITLEAVAPAPLSTRVAVPVKRIAPKPQPKPSSISGGLRADRLPAKVNGPRIAMPLPPQLHLPIPEGAQLCVQLGDAVKKGQCLTEPQSPRPLHASSSGRIIDIAHQQSASDRASACVSIQTDGRDDWAAPQPLPASHRSREQIIAHLRACGVLGLGGGGFSTADKLAQAADYLIINAIECDPAITCDRALIDAQAQEIVQGVQIAQQALAASRVLIGIDRHQQSAIVKLQTAIESLGAQIELVPITDRYPSGSEGQLIKLLLGYELPRATPPTEHGICLLNIATAHAIYRAIALGRPLVSRLVTLSGDAIAQAGNIEAPLGTPIRHLIEAAGGYTKTDVHLTLGGALSGLEIAHDNLPVLATTNAIIVREQQPKPVQKPCIRCGLCEPVCPARLLPQQLYQHIRADDLKLALDYHLDDCIECGACDAVCPSHIPLTQSYRQAKRQRAQQLAEQRQGELAQARFEAREQRLAQEAAAQRQAHDQTLKTIQSAPAASPPNEIAQALARARARAELHSD